MSDSSYRLVRFIIEIIKLSLVFYGIFEYKMKNKLFFIFALATSLALVSFSHTLDFSISSFIYGLLSIFIVSLAADGVKRFLYGLLCYIFICIVDIIPVTLLSFLIGANVSDFEKNKLQNIFFNSFSLIIILIVILIKIICKKKLKTAIQRVKITQLLTFVIVAMACILNVTAVQFMSLEAWNSRTRSMVAVSLSFGGFLFIWICATIVIANNSKNHFKETSIMNERIIKQQEEYYITLIKKNDEIGKFKHDIKNHLFCMNALLASKKYNELERYFEKMDEKFTEIDFGIETGNELVNVIINSLMQKYEKTGIKVRWIGKFPAEFKISNTDICTIFSNLLANAFEGAESCKENGVIEVIVKTLNTNLFISISNSFDNKIVLVNGEFSTTKSSKCSHGFGLKNVEACVDQFNGSVEYDHDNHLFMVNVTMPNVLRLTAKETYMQA